MPPRYSGNSPCYCRENGSPALASSCSSELMTFSARIWNENHALDDVFSVSYSIDESIPLPLLTYSGEEDADVNFAFQGRVRKGSRIGFNFKNIKQNNNGNAFVCELFEMINEDWLSLGKHDIGAGDGQDTQTDFFL